MKLIESFSTIHVKKVPASPWGETGRQGKGKLSLYNNYDGNYPSYQVRKNPDKAAWLNEQIPVYFIWKLSQLRNFHWELFEFI